ncbi:hypothetical protein [Phenylobacterium sp.]|jgi:hypothetical protein|uniref:hypothetical protein n=1 Tax=Phenylobacterium sp. TaxID=1871053 RepID=UPI002F93CF16
MIRTVMALAATAALLAACGDSSKNAEGGDNTNGPAVAASETPRNEAVDTTPTADGAAQTPGANSFTEAQARSAIEGAGYGEVGALTQDASGIWKGQAVKDGKKATVSVDYKGAVTAG